MSFSKSQVSFSSNFASLFAKNEPIKVENLRILSVQVEILQIYVIFETTNQFFYEFCVNLQIYET